MAGTFYDHTTYPVFKSSGSSATARAEFIKIETAFNKFPDLSSANALKILGINSGGTAVEAVTSTGTGNVVRATDPTFTLTDTVTNDASTSQHGWMKKFPGGTTTFLRGDGNFAGTGNASMIAVQRSSNTVLAVTDTSKIFELTGTFTQTFNAVSTLAVGWYVVLINVSTGDITLDPSGAETIDGLATYIMYPGEARIIYVNEAGTALKSIILQPFYRKATSGFTYVHPPGYIGVDLDMVGGAGGAGSGRKGAAGSLRQGGASGGAPARIIRRVLLAANTSVTVSIGAAGTAGASQTVDSTDGNSGTAGGNTTFGTYVTAYGGAAGVGGSNSAVYGHVTGSGSLGGGTSIWCAINTATIGGSPARFNAALSAVGYGVNADYENGGGNAINGSGGNAIYGGAAASSNDTSAGTAPSLAGSSFFGIGAGGWGASVDAANTPGSAGTAGKTGGWGLTGAAGGTSGGAPTAGANGAAAGSSDFDMGNPGGGGGSTATAGVNGAVGGNGTFPGGPGGGGGACTNGAGNSGAGGTSQAGQAIIMGVM